MPTIVTTAGASNANSYVTVEEADALAAVLGAIPYYGVDTAGWDAATDEIKAYALVEAAGGVDTLAFVGNQQTSTQARAFPRVRTGLAALNETVPECVKLAQVAEACALLTAPSTTEQARRDGLTGYSVGDRSETFGAASGTARRRHASTAAEEILRRGGVLLGRVGAVFLPRG